MPYMVLKKYHPHCYETLNQKALKKHIFHFVSLFCFLLAIEANGQVTHYLAEEYPTTFSTIEAWLGEDEVDSVLIASEALLSTETDLRRKGIAHFYRGEVEFLIGQEVKGEKSLEEAIRLFLEKEYEKGLAIAYSRKADLLLAKGEVDEGRVFYSQSIAFAQNEKLDEVLIDVYQKQALTFASSPTPDSAISLLKLALGYALQDEEQSKNIINQISTNYHALGQLDSAIVYFQRGLELKKRMDDPDGLISDHSALGNLYRERGEYEKAQEQLMEALNIAETTENVFAMMTIYSELGDIYAAQQIWNVSENYYTQSLELARQKNSRFREAGCFKKLGHIFQLQDKDSAAVASYDAALEIYTQLKNKRNAAEVMISLSQVYENESQYQKAKELLEEALATRGSQDMMSILPIKLSLADIEIKLGNVQTGIAYAEACVQSFEKMEDKEGMRQAYLLLSGAYSQAGNYKKAFQFHQAYSAIKDSLISVERAEAIKKYDLLVTTKKKDEEISQQNEKIKNQGIELLKRNNQVLLLAGGLAFIGLVAGLLFFIYYKNKQLNQQRIHVMKKEQETQRLKSIIEGEEKERKRLARELHDGLGAVLATVKMQISGIQRKFPDVQTSETYQKAETLIDDACRTVREVSHDLMPYVLEQQGLFSAIGEMCQNLSSQHDTSFDFIPFGNEDQLNDVLTITLYRITQELLKNILKHAEAKEVIVQLTLEDDEIMLIVEDDGKGFDTSLKKKGIGLDNIYSRAAYLDGTLEIESTIGQGSTFTILLPTQQK